MSARVFKPIPLMEMSRIRASPPPNTDRRFACRGVAKVRRALFEPVDHDETHRFLEEELAKQAASECEKWEFDFFNEVPIVTKGRYEWKAISKPPNMYIHRPEPKRPVQIEETNNCDHLYYTQPQENSLTLTSEDDMSTDEVTPNKGQSKKQSLITDFMAVKKRSDASFSKKLDDSTSRPQKIARMSLSHSTS